MLKLRKIGQRKFMEHYPDLDFRKIFGKNYLDDAEQEETINLEGEI